MTEQERLIRECYGLHTRVGYRDFHKRYFDDPSAIRDLPDPTIRNRVMKELWLTQSETLAHFTVRVKRLNLVELLTLRANLLSDLAGLPFEERLQAMMDVSMNDNVRGRSR